jgi:predicted CXXCH cytochrome family protein
MTRPTALTTAAFFLFAGLAGAAAAAPAEVPEAVSACLDCHGMEGFVTEYGDGSEMDLYVGGERFLHSVHGDELVCTDCHDGYEDGEHPSGAVFEDETAYKLLTYDLCRKCHFDTYTRTLESVHYALLQEVPEMAPVCSDCHGSHEIADPHDKQATMSRSCAQCHDGVYKTYLDSVHGHALVDNHVAEVPACSDCHTAHSIEDPSTAAFHMASPDICIECHGDDELMRRFGIATTVADTYLADFHGVTATLADPHKVDDRRLVVTCVDCHGVHDIASPAAMAPGAMKEKVAETCNGCHEGAAGDFPQAWLSHFPPSLTNAPLVFLVDLFYTLFIPFMLIGLMLHVGLHLYRVAAHR